MNSEDTRVVLPLAIDGISGGEATFVVLGHSAEGRVIYALVGAVLGRQTFDIEPSTVDPATGKLVPCRADVRLEHKPKDTELIEKGLGAGYVDRTALMPGMIIHVLADGERTSRYSLAKPALTQPVASLPGRPDIPAYPLLIEVGAPQGLAVFMRRRRLALAAA